MRAVSRFPAATAASGRGPPKRAVLPAAGGGAATTSVFVSSLVFGVRFLNNGICLPHDPEDSR